MAEGLLADDQDERRRTWLDDVAATFRTEHLAAVPMLAVDPRTGAIVGATPAATDLLGCGLGEDIGTLSERGTLAAPELRDAVRRTRDWLDSLDPDAVSEEADVWTDDVRVHSGSNASLVRLHVLYHRRPLHGGELAVVTVTPLDAHAEPASPTSPPARTELWSVLDSHARIVATDPGWSVLWANPERTVGTLVSLLVHPEDLAEILPISQEMFAGRLPDSTYTVRLAADDGRWVPVEVHHRALRTGSDLMVVASNRIVDESRRVILPGVLTARETEVVAALFDGQRVAQIADRFGTSVHTVRNQLRSVYRKLHVTGQADLIARFHRPAVH